MEELDSATSALYEAFAGYPLKPKIEGCPHCKLDSAEAALHSRPLRELGWAEFDVYPSKAMTTFGDENDFKHFLPRILELFVIRDTGAGCDIFVIFGKMRSASWAEWPDPEKQAVRRFVDAWRRSLERLPPEGDEEDEGNWRLEELDEALVESGFETWGAA